MSDSPPLRPSPLTDRWWIRSVVTVVAFARLLPRLARQARRVALARLQFRSLQVFAWAGERRQQSESGQGTVEYALVLLGAAAIALLLVAWVARTDLVGRLFDTVVGKILGRA